MIQEKIQENVTEKDISNVYRVGRRIGDKIRPIIIELTAQKTKSKLLKNRNKLKGTKIFLNDDLCFEDRKDLRQLRVVFSELKMEGKNVQIKGKKLILNGKYMELNKQRKNCDNDALQISEDIQESNKEKRKEIAVEKMTGSQRKDGDIGTYFFRRRSPAKKGTNYSKSPLMKESSFNYLKKNPFYFGT